MTDTLAIYDCEVAIIGGGPSGLAAATELKRLGLKRVIILEREAYAGGIPRHCGHPPFGMREFKRVYTGQRYAQNLVKRAKKARVTFRFNTTVSAIEPDGCLQLSTLEGLQTLKAERVIICTGARETPRAGRLVSGQRPAGVMTTGTLQSAVYLHQQQPFKQPVIIGTELVSFSALLTCRHAKIRPVAMIEPNARITSKMGSQSLSALLGVPIHLNTTVIEIIGKQTVTGLKVRDALGDTQLIECDGVIFTGQFIPESSLMRASHLKVNPQTGLPLIDQFNRCSDPNYFAIGNMTHPVETAGTCWQEGVDTAQHIHASLTGSLNQRMPRIEIKHDNAHIKYVTPSLIALPIQTNANTLHIKLKTHSSRISHGRLIVQHKSQTLNVKNISALPERKITLKLPDLSGFMAEDTLNLMFEASD
ncbi:MAG: NAD(P)/FAD-dependent oxidoreductase [Arenicellales bacterium]